MLADRAAPVLTIAGLAANFVGFGLGREGLMLAGGAVALVGAWALAYVAVSRGGA